MAVSVGSPIYTLVSANGTFYAGGTFGLKYYAAQNGWVDVGSSRISGTVNTLAFDSMTNTLYAGGSFASTTSNDTLNHVAKISISTIGVPNGSWQALGVTGNIGVGCSAPCTPNVMDLKIAATDTIIVAGQFATAGGGAVKNIAQYNTSSRWSPVAAGFDSPISSMTSSASTPFISGAFGIGRMSPNVFDKVSSFSAVSAGSAIGLLYGSATSGEVKIANYDSDGSAPTWKSSAPISNTMSSWPSAVGYGRSQDGSKSLASWLSGDKFYHRTYSATWGNISAVGSFGEASFTTMPQSLDGSGNLPVFFTRGSDTNQISVTPVTLTMPN